MTCIVGLLDDGDIYMGGDSASVDMNDWSLNLVGVRGRLFHVYSGFDCVEYRDNYGTVGCAYQVALGSMYATSELPPKQRIKTALKAAEKYSAGVRAPFQIKVLKGTD